MTSADIQKQILAMAIMVRVEGMKASNERCKINGEVPMWSEDHFQSSAHELENLAYS